MAGAIGKPPPRLRRGEIPRPQTRPPRLLPQKELSCVKRMTEATPPTPHVRGGSVSRRGLNQAAGTRAQLTGGTKPEEKSQPKRQPLFGREREEGKDSHSRQWRLSMAVFLNRNKRPQAAPIEVAELLSEKPPPSHTPHTFLTPRPLRNR